MASKYISRKKSSASYRKKSLVKAGKKSITPNKKMRWNPKSGYKSAAAWLHASKNKYYSHRRKLYSAAWDRAMKIILKAYDDVAIMPRVKKLQEHMLSSIIIQEGPNPSLARVKGKK